MKEQNEKQAIEEMAKVVCNDTRCKTCIHHVEVEDCVATKTAKRLYKAGYRKQSVGEWVCEVKHYFDDYGDLRVYVTAHCSECKTPYRDNHNVDYEFIERPDNLGYADWNIDVEPIKKRVLERAKTRSLHKYCHECGAKMKGGAE